HHLVAEYVCHRHRRARRWQPVWRMIRGTRTRLIVCVARPSRLPYRFWRWLGCGAWLLHRLAYRRCRHPYDSAPRFPDVTHLGSPLVVLLAFVVLGIDRASRLGRST